MNEVVKVLLELLLVVLVVILPFWRLTPALMAWAFARPLFTVLVAVVLAVVYRTVGVDYGLPELFWHEDPFIQFWAGFWVCLLFGLIVTLFLANEPIIVIREPAPAPLPIAEATPVPASATPTATLLPSLAAPTLGHAEHHSLVEGSASRPAHLPLLTPTPTTPANTSIFTLTSDIQRATNSAREAPAGKDSLAQPVNLRAVLEVSDTALPVGVGVVSAAVRTDLEQARVESASALAESIRLTLAGRPDWQWTGLRRVYASSEVAAACLGAPPTWLGKTLKPLGLSAGETLSTYPPFALYTAKVLLLLMFLIALLIPPTMVSVVDRSWSWFKYMLPDPHTTLRVNSSDIVREFKAFTNSPAKRLGGAVPPTSDLAGQFRTRIGSTADRPGGK